MKVYKYIGREKEYIKEWNKANRNKKRIWMWNKRHPKNKRKMPEGNSKWKDLGN